MKNGKKRTKTFHLIVQHPFGENKTFTDTNLQNIMRIKHNYKTSPHFKDAYISPIFDDINKSPLIASVKFKKVKL